MGPAAMMPPVTERRPVPPVLDVPALPMQVGPTRSSPTVLAAAGRQCPPFPERAFLDALATCVMESGRLLGVPPDGGVVVLPGTGTAGLESLALSLLPPGSAVLVIVTGAWSLRWAQACERIGLRVRAVTAPPGLVPSGAAVAEALAAFRPDAVLATHVDSSTGVRIDLDALAAVVRPTGALLLADGVCAAGADHVDIAAWGIDGYVTSSAKALSSPGGIVVVGLSGRAVDVLREPARQCASLALDLAPWLDSMAAARRGEFSYVQSPAGNLVLALAQALTEIRDEGPQTRVARHVALRDRLHAGLARLGLRNLVPDPEHRCNGVTVCLLDRPESRAVIDRVRAAGVLLPQSTTPGLVERTVRIGHLGNIGTDDVDRTVAALARALRSA